MKKNLILLAAVCAPLTGCGFLNKSVSTATGAVGGLLNTVTSPVRGVMNAAEPGQEKAWQEKADAEDAARAQGKQKKVTRAGISPVSHDRRRPQAQRRR